MSTENSDNKEKEEDIIKKTLKENLDGKSESELQTRLLQVCQAVDKKITAFKSKKNQELTKLREEHEILLMKYEKKEKERVSLSQALSKSRKESQNLRAKVDTDSQLQDYHFVKGEVFRLTNENNDLKAEVKGLKSSCYKQGKELTKIIDKHDYDNKIAILKQDIAYEKEKVRELEKKCNSQEAQLKSQHETIAKLKAKNIMLKDGSTAGKKVKEVLSPETVEMIEKLEKTIEILQKSKESEFKKDLIAKAKYEKKFKKLVEKCEVLENEIKEKDKENKLHAIKMKDIIRSQSNFNRTRRVKKLPNLNSSTASSKNSNIHSLNGKNYETEPGSGRSRSIDPQRIKLKSKARINTNLKVTLKSSRGLKQGKVVLKNKKHSNFESELQKANAPSIAAIDTNTQQKIMDDAQKNKLMKSLFDDPSPTDLIQTEPDGSNKGVTFAPGTILEKQNHTKANEVPPEDPADDKFENLGGNIEFMDMNVE
ncbi:unnamed protein product [Moneuplotes crassus]|uniref:Lebercilin domain-containing protein n=1 Tax=Euplotes crassus TaxID=5936 RepID=A0AAD1XBL7_EUPCR|nr:unnamed protein product [Moneuplotes crassus]